MLHVFIK